MKYLQFFPLLLLCLTACSSQKQSGAWLVTQLGSPDAKERRDASKTLVTMGPSVIDALRFGISHENPQIREASAWVLSDIAVAVCRQEPNGGPPADIMSALLSVLTDSDENVCVVGSIALQHVGPPAVPYLIDALDSASMSTRLHVAYALGEIGEPHALIVPALIDTLTDPVWNVRRLVVRALVSIGVPAIPRLKEVLSGAEPERARMAIRALNDIGTPEARQAIKEAHRAGDTE